MAHRKRRRDSSRRCFVLQVRFLKTHDCSDRMTSGPGERRSLFPRVGKPSGPEEEEETFPLRGSALFLLAESCNRVKE